MPPVLKPVLNTELKDWDCHAHKIQKRTLPKTEGKRGGLKDWDCHVASLLAMTEEKRGLFAEFTLNEVNVLTATEGNGFFTASPRSLSL